MKGIEDIPVGGGSTFITGYNAAEFVGLKEVSSQKGEFTVAEIKVEGSNATYPESIYLTNEKDIGKKAVIDMLLVACGMQPTTPEEPIQNVMARINACKGAKVAALLYPQYTNPKNPDKAYHAILQNGIHKRKDEDIFALMPISHVGTLVDMADLTSTAPKPKATNTTNVASTQSTVANMTSNTVVPPQNLKF